MKTPKLRKPTSSKPGNREFTCKSRAEPSSLGLCRDAAGNARSEHLCSNSPNSRTCPSFCHSLTNILCEPMVEASSLRREPISRKQCREEPRIIEFNRCQKGTARHSTQAGQAKRLCFADVQKPISAASQQWLSKLTIAFDLHEMSLLPQPTAMIEHVKTFCPCYGFGKSCPDKSRRSIVASRKCHRYL